MTGRPDVIVIGGGSAGSVFAARIAENPDLQVLVLEAGPGFDSSWPADLLDASHLPIGPGSPWTDVFDVDLTPERRATISRGRVLGGSGAVNGAYFVRGRPDDFSAWPQSHWSWPQVLESYRRSESDVDFSGPDHGNSGPIPVSRAVDVGSITRDFENACARAGFTSLKDLNSSVAGDGYGRVPSNVADGQRINAALAYLTPKPNLTVRTGVSVGRVLFDGTTVVGIEGRDRNGKFTIGADVVVLAGGAVRTPSLLAHSGIGRPADLDVLGVDVLVDLPDVGHGFSDHPEVAVPYRRAPDDEGATPLQSVLHIEGVEIRPFSAAFDRMIAGLPIGDPSFGVALMDPESRGEIAFAQDRYAAPRIHYHYLESARDRATLQAGVNVARSLLSSMGVALSDPADLPDRLGTSLHLCGSARMGAVVDDRCRVFGVDGLRIVDTSIFPRIPRRGPHATAVMAAERAAELYKEDL